MKRGVLPPLAVVLAIPLVFSVATAGKPARAQGTPPAAAVRSAIVKPDPKAVALLGKARDRLLATKTLSTVVESISEGKDEAGQQLRSRLTVTSRLMKPNYMHVIAAFELQGTDGVWKPQRGDLVFASDGKTHWQLSSNRYYTQPAKAPAELHSLRQLPTEGFFSGTTSPGALVATLLKEKRLLELRRAGKESWNGDDYDVVVLREKGEVNGEPSNTTKRFYIGADGFIRRIQETITVGDEPETILDWQVTSLVAGAPMKPAAFAYAPPRGALSAAQERANRPKPLAAGTVAPDFSVVDKNGEAVKLSDYRGKTVVLDFWATWCGPCIASLPETNAVARKMASKGVVTLAINVWDTKAAFDKWLPKNEKKYDSVKFVFDPSPTGHAIAGPLYHVSSIPTQYFVDRDGKIRNSLEEALAAKPR